jgi:hypothetical protein
MTLFECFMFLGPETAAVGLLNHAPKEIVAESQVPCGIARPRTTPEGRTSVAQEVTSSSALRRFVSPSRDQDLAVRK